MICLHVSDEQREYCEQRLYMVKGDPDPRTHQVDQKSKLWGFISEVAICDLYGYPRPYMGKSDGGKDIVTPSGARIDIKSIRIRAERPKSNYLSKVYRIHAERHNRPDYFIFCSYNMERGTVWIKGIIGVEAFYDQSVLYLVGDEIPGAYRINRPVEEQYVIEDSFLAPMYIPA